MWIFNCKLSDNLSHLCASFFTRSVINTCNNDNDDDNHHHHHHHHHHKNNHNHIHSNHNNIFLCESSTANYVWQFIAFIRVIFFTRFIINTCNNDTDDDDKRNGLLSAHEIAIKSINEVSMYSRGLLFYQIIPQRNDRKILWRYACEWNCWFSSTINTNTLYGQSFISRRCKNFFLKKLS